MIRRAGATAAAVLTAATVLLPFQTPGHPATPVLTPPAPVQGPRAPIAAAASPATIVAAPRMQAFERDEEPPANRSPHNPRPATKQLSKRKQHASKPKATYVDLGRWRVTKYCSTGNRTASNTWPAIGEAATLDRGIPFGTLLRIVGRDLADGRWIDQTFAVTDRIGHGSDLDLYAGGEGDPSCEPRVDRTWGLQHLTVYLVRAPR